MDIRYSTANALEMTTIQYTCTEYQLRSHVVRIGDCDAYCCTTQVSPANLRFGEATISARTTAPEEYHSLKSVLSCCSHDGQLQLQHLWYSPQTSWCLCKEGQRQDEAP